MFRKHYVLPVHCPEKDMIQTISQCVTRNVQFIYILTKNIFKNVLDKPLILFDITGIITMTHSTITFNRNIHRQILQIALNMKYFDKNHLRLWHPLCLILKRELEIDRCDNVGVMILAFFILPSGCIVWITGTACFVWPCLQKMDLFSHYFINLSLTLLFVVILVISIITILLLLLLWSLLPMLFLLIVCYQFLIYYQLLLLRSLFLLSCISIKIFWVILVNVMILVFLFYIFSDFLLYLFLHIDYYCCYCCYHR